MLLKLGYKQYKHLQDNTRTYIFLNIQHLVPDTWRYTITVGMTLVSMKQLTLHFFVFLLQEGIDILVNKLSDKKINC